MYNYTFKRVYYKGGEAMTLQDVFKEWQTLLEDPNIDESTKFAIMYRMYIEQPNNHEYWQTLIDTLNILRTYDQFKLAFATNITIEEFKKQLTQDIQIDKLQKVATTYPELNNNYVSFTQVIEYLQELSKAQDIRAIADGIHKILDYIISTISSKEEQAQKQTGFLDNYITMKIQTFSL